MAKASRYQQPEKLRDRMREAGVSHGATVRADIIGAHTAKPVVRTETGGLVTSAFGPTKIFFCNMPEGSGFRVREVLQPGDGGRVTDRVHYDDSLRRLIAGLDEWSNVDIENAIVANNGSVRIQVDRETRVVVTDMRHRDKPREVYAVIR